MTNKIAVIIGSVRPNRFGDKPAKWIAKLIGERPDTDVELLDLLDFPMPFFNEASSPAGKKVPYENEVVEKWTAKIGAADGYVFVAPEYNHGTSAVMKNALDWVYKEWARKPVTFVGYGGVSGARAIEHLRLVSIELNLAPLRSAVHLPSDFLREYAQGHNLDEKFAASEKFAKQTIDDLLWWTNALKQARG